MTYEHIAKLLNGIAERFDWEKIMEGDNIIALKQVKLLYFFVSFSCLSRNPFHICVIFKDNA